MPTFDEHGHLAPPNIHELSLLEFEAIFVDGMPDRAHRRALFEDYLRFANAIKGTFKTPFYQWVAGSFVTTKELPGDVDIVTFLPHDVLATKSGHVQWFKEHGKTDFQVDASFCPFCKWNHRFYDAAQAIEAELRELYAFDRPDKMTNFRRPKGIIKLHFTS